MDTGSIAARVNGSNNPVYDLTCALAGNDQSAFTVDRLAYKLKAILPGLVAALADDVEKQNEQEHYAHQQGRDFQS
jgi:hypothetical protein